MKNAKVRKVVISAMFLAIGIVLPFFTGQIKEIGDTLLPMHIPVMLAGFICGWQWGLVVGFVLPILRSMLFSMPPMFPNAMWMAAELASYGAVAGIVYSKSRKIYVSLILAQISGRVVWGVTKAILLGFSGKVFTLGAFVTGGFLDAIPGIILQLILIPIILKSINRKKEYSDERGTISVWKRKIKL